MVLPPTRGVSTISRGGVGRRAEKARPPAGAANTPRLPQAGDRAMARGLTGEVAGREIRKRDAKIGGVVAGRLNPVVLHEPGVGQISGRDPGAQVLLRGPQERRYRLDPAGDRVPLLGTAVPPSPEIRHLLDLPVDAAVVRDDVGVDAPLVCAALVLIEAAAALRPDHLAVDGIVGSQRGRIDAIEIAE